MAVRIIVGGHLSCNNLGAMQAPPHEERASRLRPEDEELVQWPAIERENAELLEQCMQSPQVGKRWPGWLESNKGEANVHEIGDKVPGEVLL